MALTTPEWGSIGDSARGNRLDCWKEIAAYLGRSEKTVRRWETERGLPTHRAPGGGRTSVYAYTAELNEWLKLRRAQVLDAAEAGEETAEPPAEQETPGTAIPETVIAGRISGPAEAQPAATAGNSRIDRHGFSLGWKPVFAGILVAGAVGVAAYAVAFRSASGRIPQRISSMFGVTDPVSVHPGSSAVSDAEKRLARDFYLKGRYEWNQRNPESLNRALDDFTQSIIHDPNSAPAYAGMADTYDMLRIYSTMPQADAYSRAIGAARRAVELDDSLPEAHRALAFAEYWGTWNFADAEKEFRRAIELNPRDPLAHKWFADGLSTQGRCAESLEEVSKAQELDPGSHSTLADKGTILFEAGKRKEGIALLKDVERAAPELSSPHQYLMIAGFELRDYPAYLAEGEKTAETMNDPALKEIIASARAGYAREGERGLLKNLYTIEEKYYAEGKTSRIGLALACVRLGKKQEALHLLEEAYEHHDPATSLASLISGSGGEWTPLKDEPRFQALLKKANPSMVPGQPSPSEPPALANAQFRAAAEPR
jgi:tetratricopeptide (TPR) repeat protein